MNICPYVYRCDHPVTGEFYIGYRSANKLPAQEDLGHKYFTSSKFVKPRFDEFKITIIAEFFDKDAAYEFEQQLIHENWGAVGILNSACHYGKAAFVNVGSPMSDEHKKKMSIARKGKKLSEDHKKKLSESHKGTKLSDEHCKNISGSNKGRIFTEEHKKKLAEARKNRAPHSAETRKKMSDSKKNFIFTDEHKAKLSAAKRGKIRSPNKTKVLPSTQTTIQEGILQ